MLSTGWLSSTLSYSPNQRRILHRLSAAQSTYTVIRRVCRQAFGLFHDRSQRLYGALAKSRTLPSSVFRLFSSTGSHYLLMFQPLHSRLLGTGLVLVIPYSPALPAFPKTPSRQDYTYTCYLRSPLRSPRDPLLQKEHSQLGAVNQHLPQAVLHHIDHPNRHASVLPPYADEF